MLVVGIFVEPTRPTAPALSTFGQPNMTFGVRDISLKHNHGGELLPDGFIQTWDLLAHWDSEATFGGDWMEQVAKFPANNSVPFTPTASPLAPAPWPQLPGPSSPCDVLQHCRAPRLDVSVHEDPNSLGTERWMAWKMDSLSGFFVFVSQPQRLCLDGTAA